MTLTQYVIAIVSVLGAAVAAGLIVTVIAYVIAKSRVEEDE